MLRNSDANYGLVAILFHWSIAALFFGLLALGYLMPRIENLTLQFELYQWHKSFGFLALALSVARLAWGLTARRPREPASLSPLERCAARATHLALYGLLLLIPLTGWAVASVTPLNIPSFAFNLVVIPHLPMEKSEAAESFWSQAHALLAYFAGALAVGHMLAALRHQFLLKDDTLMRMLRPRRKSDDVEAKR